MTSVPVSAQASPPASTGLSSSVSAITSGHFLGDSLVISPGNASGISPGNAPGNTASNTPGNASDIHTTRVLSLDSSGRILDWISWQEAVCLYVRGAVAWTLGEACLTIHGGQNRSTGLQTTLDLHPIVASRSRARHPSIDPAPALTNIALFSRDRHVCLYCGDHFARSQLTRDHVIPLSKGGRDHWENVVSACIGCNVHKGNRTPAQAQMPLLAVPYRPSWVEHLILSNRNILVDQMAFLRSHLPKSRRNAA